MKRVLAAIALSVACLAAPPALAVQDRETAKERLFLLNVAQSQQGDMALAKMATQQAGSDRVKEFGHRIIDDFSKANQQVMALAGAEGVALFKRMPAEDQEKAEHLAHLSGPEFDKAYMNYLIKAHGQDLREFEQNMKQIKDPTLKQWAEETMSVLQDHLDMARHITASLSTESQE